MESQRKSVGPAGYTLSEVPRYVQYVSPVSVNLDSSPRATTLPLNLLALIISYLDDIGDIARVTRTSRLLYYMTLPQLYQRVTLHSYAEMRKVNGRPEGFGSGSPFIMAVNGLVTKAHTSLVQDFRVWGNWRKYGVEDFAEGRVPDNTMMLNILLRAATDKMTKLESFAWELDCKPLKTVYQGLATRDTLTSLTIKFPSSRMPRPSVIVPPIPNLRVFKATDIDPLCYCDDISLLLLQSKKLEDVRLHFSPRMRREAEPSVNLNSYFGRCLKADYKLPIKHLGMANFFGYNMEGMDNIFDQETCRRVTFMDTFGGNSGNARNIFADISWKEIPPSFTPNFTTIRANEVRSQHVALLEGGTGLEKFYYVSASPDTPAHDGGGLTPSTPGSEAASLGKEFLSALTRNHGSTIKHLLLYRKWLLNEEEISTLVRCCPNLEQLGLALDISCSSGILRLLMPFLSKLKVLRILHNDWLERELQNMPHEKRMGKLSSDIAKNGDKEIQYICLGDLAYKIGKPRMMHDEYGSGMRREVTVVRLEDVKGVEIIDLDTIDISADPVLPFSP